jgi:hypothetical protein
MATLGALKLRLANPGTEYHGIKLSEILLGLFGEFNARELP